jgi:hypothetical protein
MVVCQYQVNPADGFEFLVIVVDPHCVLKENVVFGALGSGQLTVTDLVARIVVLFLKLTDPVPGQRNLTVTLYVEPDCDCEITFPLTIYQFCAGQIPSSKYEKETLEPEVAVLGPCICEKVFSDRRSSKNRSAEKHRSGPENFKTAIVSWFLSRQNDRRFHSGRHW